VFPYSAPLHTLPPPPKERVVSLFDTHSVHAPEFLEDLDWIGVAEPPRMEDLRGKIVLLDFWTAG
jgi:hypothetical protein